LRQRGATLLEVMISLAVVLGGTLAMVSVLGSSLAGSASAARVDQAEARAQMLLESLRLAPPAALECLAATAPAEWSRCQAGCAACSFTVEPAPYRLVAERSFVKRRGRIWDAQVSVGWGGPHQVTLRSGVFR
jgi:type II secretory pathway pseudopilin PulG